MTRVFLIRHAEAEGNIFRRSHGHYDSYITARGRRQVAALAERFRYERIDALYSSDLRRARATACAITKYHDLNIELDPRLREQYMGPWEDQPWGNLEFLDSQNMWRFNNDPALWCPGGAESFESLQDRMLEAVMEIAGKHDGQTAACISHGMAIRSLLGKIMGVASADMPAIIHGDNTSVTLLEVSEGNIDIVYMNDNSHLPPEISTFARQAWWQSEDSRDDSNMRLEPLNPNIEGEIYTQCYAEAWRAVHGTLEGFRPLTYLSEARAHYSVNEFSILKAIKNDKLAGMIDLDMQRGQDEGYGWISLIYVVEEERRRQLGVQLLGHAVTLSRRLGRTRLRLSVAEINTAAIKFYEEYEFLPVGQSEGVLGPLLIMERKI